MNPTRPSLLGSRSRSRSIEVLLRCTAFLLTCTVLLLGAPLSHAHLLDTFDRADSASVGNGWIEKNPAAFALAGNQVSKAAVTTGYVDNVVYRPSTEDVADVEAALEFRLLSPSPGYPQVLVRAQSATVASAGTLDAYMLYIDGSASRALLARQRGTAFATTLATLNLSSALNTTGRFRLRLRATGSSPVQLAAYVERQNGALWEVIGQANVNDNAVNRIVNAGAAAFSGYIESSYIYDNFTRVDLGAAGAANPAPTTAGLAPTSAITGESGLTLIVYGSGFTTDSVVRWNGADRLTAYVSPSELEASVTAADLAVAGSFAVTVINPAPGGGTSAAQIFQVLTPGVTPPAVSSLSPASATAGDAAFTLTVNGSNFDAGSVVRWNGGERATTFVSATQLQVAIAAADVAASGTAEITVRRGSDGALSNAQSFTIATPPPSADFVDDFNRADNAVIGNGWLEKSPSAFTLVANEAAKAAAGGNDYRNNLVYRPVAEDLLDVEAATELRLLSLPVGYPQVAVRVQNSTVASTNTLDAYLLYMNDSATQAVLARQRGSSYDTALVTLALASALNTTDRYRLRLRATGTNPVQLGAFVERWTGTAWQTLAQTSFNDGAASRIAAAGSVGFGGYIETNYRYDNFSRTSLGAPSPAPTTSGLSPASAGAGSIGFNLLVNGSSFVPGSIVRWNGSDRLTTYVSATQLAAQINAADVAAAGSAAVTVFTAAPGGGTSNAQTFSITAPAENPVPALSSLAPASAVAGGGPFVLTVSGTGFVPASAVRWNGAARTTTYVSQSQLTAQITAADVAAAGSATVTVFTSSPGGGTSGGLTFTVTAAASPTPATTGLSPSSATAGTPGFTMSVLGGGFVNSSVVRWNGADRSTTFISSSELRATISAADISSAGANSVTVFTASPGGGTSNSQSFVVSEPTPTNPAPALMQLDPQTAQPGSGAITLSVLGSGFTADSVVQWNGAARPTTYVSGARLQAEISSSDLATGGLATVTVSTPAPGGGLSVPLPFFIQDASIGYFFDGFNRPDAAAVGNDWTEKNPGAFSLFGNQLVSFDTTGGFQEDIMYRGAAAEDRLDVETSVEFVRQASQPQLENANFPQLHARVQRSSVTQAFTLDSYIFFIDDISGRGMIAITRSITPGARWECYLAAVPLSQSLVEGERYRLRMSVAGTAPVQLNGTVERFSAGAWLTIGSGSTTHDTSTTRDPALYCDKTTVPGPITTAGSVGVAKWVNRTDNYDNFFWRDPQPGNSPPVISALDPQAVAAGSPGFELVVTGSGFMSDAVVRWNGTNRPTTFVSPTELRATISSADINTPATANVSVQLSGSSLVSGNLPFQVQSVGAVETLFDAFDRADGAPIGNGWLEKTPAAFSIASGGVQKLSTPGGDYRNNLVYRPVEEDVLNTEASLEFRLQSLPVGYPQLAVRVQADTVALANRFDGYVLYMADSTTRATLSRQRGTGFDTPLASITLSQALNTADTYRMRLSATGTNPVTLTGSLERLSGGAWQVLGQATFNDTSTSRISTAGSVAFSGYVEGNYAYDNFRRVYLGQ